MTKYLTPEEIKSELLAMLIEFDGFCAKEGLKYSLIGGTLLGAVRHKGFIPWDDDIDLGMPRPDYERLISLGKDRQLPGGFSIMPFSGDWNHPVFIKLLNDGIEVDARYENGVGCLWLDINPVDGLPDDSGELDNVYRRATRLQKLITFCKADSRQGKTFAKRVFKRFLVPLANNVGLLPLAVRELDCLGKRYEFGETPWAGCLAWGLYGPGERCPLSGWEKMAHFEFEGREFPGVGCWDEYLHGIYGDYTQLPPVEKRATHEMKAWRIG